MNNIKKWQEEFLEYVDGLNLPRDDYRGIMEYIDEVPTIELRPRGKWIRKSPTAWSWTCSCCKKDDAYAYSAGKYFEPDVLQDLICPHCGADMRGEVE